MRAGETSLGAADRHDVLVLGGGPAGLSAALVFGRALVDAVVVSAGLPRSAVSPHSHGFLTRDGIAPLELVATARRELERYATVSFVEDTVTALAPVGSGFAATTAAGRELRARRVLIASGRADGLEQLGIPDLEQVYGTSVFPCPFCDGWERRGEPLAVFVGAGSPAEELARVVGRWSEDLVAFTNGGDALDAAARRRLEEAGIGVETRPIRALAHDRGRLRSVELADGAGVPRSGGFVATAGVEVVSPLLAGLEGAEGLHLAGDVELGFAGIAEGVGSGYRVAKAIVKEMAMEAPLRLR